MVGPCFDGNHLSELSGILEIAARVIASIHGKLEYKMFTLVEDRRCGECRPLFFFLPNTSVGPIIFGQICYVAEWTNRFSSATPSMIVVSDSCDIEFSSGFSLYHLYHIVLRLARMLPEILVATRLSTIGD